MMLTTKTKPSYPFDSQQQQLTNSSYSLGWNSGSPRVQGDEEEEDVDDIDNEFNYEQGNGKGPGWQLHGQGDDADLSSSARHEPHHRIPRLTSGQQV